MRPLVKTAGVSQPNYDASLPELMSQPAAGSTGVKASRPLIKLQSYDGPGSLDTFLMKFCRITDYLH